MQEEIQSFFFKHCHGLQYIPMEDNRNVEIIYELLFKQIIIPPEKLDPVLCFYFGCYVRDVVKNSYLAQLYFVKSAFGGVQRAMNLLGKHHIHHKEDQFGLIYFNEGVRLGNINAMVNLGKYYQATGQYDLMKKYYDMVLNWTDYAVDGHQQSDEPQSKDFIACSRFPPPDGAKSSALLRLGDHYRIVENNIAMAKKYYMLRRTELQKKELGYGGGLFGLAMCCYLEGDEVSMVNYYVEGANNKCCACMSNIARYYEKTFNYKLMKKYYLMGVENNDVRSMVNLGIYYQEQKKHEKAIKYFQLAVEKASEGITFIPGEGLDSMIIYYKQHPFDFSFFKVWNYFCRFIPGTENYITKSFGVFDGNEFSRLSDVDALRQSDNFQYLVLRISLLDTLPKQYHYDFCRLILSEDLPTTVKAKQDILKKTGIFPSNLRKEFIQVFKTLLLPSSSPKFPKDIMLIVAGNLFT